MQWSFQRLPAWAVAVEMFLICAGTGLVLSVLYDKVLGYALVGAGIPLAIWTGVRVVRMRRRPGPDGGQPLSADERVAVHRAVRRGRLPESLRVQARAIDLAERWVRAVTIRSAASVLVALVILDGVSLTRGQRAWPVVTYVTVLIVGQCSRIVMRRGAMALIAARLRAIESGDAGGALGELSAEVRPLSDSW